MLSVCGLAWYAVHWIEPVYHKLAKCRIFLFFMQSIIFIQAIAAHSSEKIIYFQTGVLFIWRISFIQGSKYLLK